MDIKDILKQLRKENGLSQKDIATAIGIARTTYSNYEQGLRQPDLTTVTKLCALFDVSADELLGIES